VEARKMLQNDN